MTIFAVCLYVLGMTGIVRLFLWKQKERKVWHAVFALSGLFGFLLCLPIGLYDPYSDPYLYITVAFVVQGILGFAGCWVYDINPFVREVEKRKIKNMTNQNEKQSKNGGNVFVQTQTESRSLVLIGETLAKIPPPFYLYKGIKVERLGEEEEFKMIAISPTGVYHFYPCNWGAAIHFQNVGSKRTQPSEQDTPDYTIACSYRQELLKKILHGSGFLSVPIIPLIVVTEPGVTFKHDAKNFETVHLQDLEKRITTPQKQTLSQQQMYDIKNIFENYIKK